MNMTSGYMLLLILVALCFLKQIHSVTEQRTLPVCTGQSADLIWEIDEEDQQISKLEWHYNNQIICTSSQAKKFTVNRLYRDRIEMIDKTHIRLKNISLDDEGIYILLPLLKWSTNQTMHNISLQVLEPPTTNCTCEVSISEHPPKLTYDLKTSYCGRQKVTAFWKRKQTFEVLGEGDFILINSSFQDNEILCCPEGTAMTCVNDPKQFCKSVSIPRADKAKIYSGGNNTLQSDQQRIPATCTQSTEYTNLFWMMFFVLIICSLQCAIFPLLAFIICKTRKGKRILRAIRRLLEVVNMEKKGSSHYV
ncbi:hypothetical protein ACJMK2_026032 [Sinanodonta woodiana]|uniref:Uncharacterized protein n=1 Tax=Sinanodonta woodiana TaxID=1069815 RepID=A0ABD3XK49_SINWO